MSVVLQCNMRRFVLVFITEDLRLILGVVSE
jgi:hypothetical protein